MLAGAVLPGYALTRATHGDWSTREAYGLASLAIGALVLATSLTTFLATHGRDPRVVADPSPISIATFVSGAAHVLRDRTFLPILLAYVIAQLGVAINGTFALYYYQYRLELTSDEISIVLGIFVTAWSVSIPLWVLGARRFGKRWPAFFGIVALGIVTAVIYLLCPPRELRLPITIAVVGGALAGSIVLLEALVADVVDVDRLLHRGHREGLYFGVWKMGAKVGRGLAVAGSGAMLAAIGFVPNASQTAVVRDRLAWLFGPGVGAFFVLGALVFLASPLTEARHARVQMALARRRRIEAKREAPSA